MNVSLLNGLMNVSCSLVPVSSHGAKMDSDTQAEPWDGSWNDDDSKTTLPIPFLSMTELFFTISSRSVAFSNALSIA